MFSVCRGSVGSFRCSFLRRVSSEGLELVFFVRVGCCSLGAVPEFSVKNRRITCIALVATVFDVGGATVVE